MTLDTIVKDTPIKRPNFFVRSTAYLLSLASAFIPVGCDDGGNNNNNGLQAPSITTQPELIIEEDKDHNSQIIASGNPTPTYTLVQGPTGYVVGFSDGNVTLLAGDAIRGIYQLVIDADNSEGKATLDEDLWIVSDYRTTMLDLKDRMDDYIADSQVVQFDYDETTRSQFQFDIGGGNSEYADAQIISITAPTAGIYAVLIDDLSRTDDVMARKANLEAAGHPVWLITPKPIKEDLIPTPENDSVYEDADAQGQTHGFTTP